MVQSIPAKTVELSDLEDRFGLRWVEAGNFFTEWKGELPKLSTLEQQTLDQVRTNYRYLLKYRLAESIVKMVVLSPLLNVAGFYGPPYRVSGEVGVAIEAREGDDIIKGSIDVLVVQDQLWTTVIEAKNSRFSIAEAIPQTLAYMLASPKPQQAAFGLITNGSEFLFLKVTQKNTAQYATSNIFSIWNEDNELCKVAQVLKRLGELIASG